MIVLDVNVLVYAFDEASDRYRPWAEWLSTALSGSEVVAVPDAVLTGFVRIVTDRRIFSEPTTAASAMAFVSALLDAPASALLSGTRATWRAFEDLIAQDSAIVGNLVPDAYLAALAISNDARLATADQGFKRYKACRVLTLPADDALR